MVLVFVEIVFFLVNYTLKKFKMLSFSQIKTLFSSSFYNFNVNFEFIAKSRVWLFAEYETRMHSFDAFME